jgi:hypothetical protein
MFRPALGATITSTLRIKATITTFATVFRRDPQAGRLHHDGASDDLYPAQFSEVPVHRQRTDAGAHAMSAGSITGDLMRSGPITSPARSVPGPHFWNFGCRSIDLSD